jgi:hypothetical protein
LVSGFAPRASRDAGCLDVFAAELITLGACLTLSGSFCTTLQISCASSYITTPAPASTGTIQQLITTLPTRYIRVSRHVHLSSDAVMPASLERAIRRHLTLCCNNALLRTRARRANPMFTRLASTIFLQSKDISRPPVRPRPHNARHFRFARFFHMTLSRH